MGSIDLVSVDSEPGCVSETGRRESNQDRACALRATVGSEPALLLAVADGMGGMQSGDKAAELAIEAVRHFATAVLPGVPATAVDLRRSLVELFQDANRRVWSWSEEAGCTGAAGSTLVCCLILPGRYLVAHAGDSRCYYVSNHEARQLTEDHSQVQEMVRAGAMTEEAARRSPLRNQLTNGLGEPREIRVELSPPAPCFGVIDEACALLVCSDGLHGVLADADIHRQLLGTANVADACANLVSLAFQCGSTDNISVAAAELGRLRRRRPREPRLPPIDVLRARGEAPAPGPNEPTTAPARRPRWLTALAILSIVAGAGALAAAVVLAARAGVLPVPRPPAVVSPRLPGPTPTSEAPAAGTEPGKKGPAPIARPSATGTPTPPSTPTPAPGASDSPAPAPPAPTGRPPGAVGSSPAPSARPAVPREKRGHPSPTPGTSSPRPQGSADPPIS